MTVLDHIKRYPSARTSTIAHLIEMDRTNEKLVGFVVHRECVKARGDIERIEESF